MVMVATVVVSLSAGLAFRRRFRGSTVLFYLTVASLIVPSILVSLGIGLGFQIAHVRPAWYSSAFGAHLTWTLPFGLLIMFAVFNRFDKAYEEAARDLGASSWQTLRHVVLPIILPSLIGVGLFGFTLSYDEFARTLMTSGTFNTLPLEIYGMTTNVTTPVLYALGTLTTAFSLHRHSRQPRHHHRARPPGARAWRRPDDAPARRQSQHDRVDDREDRAAARAARHAGEPRWSRATRGPGRRRSRGLEERDGRARAARGDHAPARGRRRRRRHRLLRRHRPGRGAGRSPGRR